MHATAGQEAMRQAQIEAESIKMLGVTVLTSIKEDECLDVFGAPPDAKVMDLASNAVDSGIDGIVASPLEVGLIKRNRYTQNLFAMIPGTRSQNADVQDQKRTTTPGAAIRDGADLLVIGRQVTKAEDPTMAYEAVVAEIEAAL